MGLLSIPALVRRQRVHPWPRHPRRPWVRPDDLASASAMLAAIPSLPRPTLIRLTERLIDRMDELDGDPDVELNGDELDGSLAEDDFHQQNTDWLSYAGDPDDAEDDDPAGGAVDDEGEPEEWRPEGIVLDRPHYDVDQSLGPVNEREMLHAFKRAQMESGR